MGNDGPQSPRLGPQVVDSDGPGRFRVCVHRGEKAAGLFPFLFNSYNPVLKSLQLRYRW
jgi:hypothetical protein